MRFSLILLPLLLVTVGPRVQSGDQEVDADDARFLSDASNLLQRQDFTVTQFSQSSLPHLTATKGECSLFLASEHDAGSRLDAYASMQPSGHSIRLFYRGEWTQEYPRLGPILDLYRQRYGSAFGRSVSYAPVIAVAASEGCDLSSIALESLMLHPQAY